MMVRITMLWEHGGGAWESLELKRACLEGSQRREFFPTLDSVYYDLLHYTLSSI